MKSAPWWKEATIYQIYPRSFFDSNGDGEGDLPGVTSQLDYVKNLGVDAIWLSPFYTSPNKDGGYDVANPRDVDPRFGNLEDAKELIAQAHKRNLRVIADIVPNHFSDQHEWFQAALNSKRGSKERERFHFYDANEDGTPPNNWISLFGGPSWTQVADGQFYLHLFDSFQSQHSPQGFPNSNLVEKNQRDVSRTDHLLLGSRMDHQRVISSYLEACHQL